jgi:hypothetical protein
MLWVACIQFSNLICSSSPRSFPWTYHVLLDGKERINNNAVAQLVIKSPSIRGILNVPVSPAESGIALCAELFVKGKLFVDYRNHWSMRHPLRLSHYDQLPRDRLWHHTGLNSLQFVEDLSPLIPRSVNFSITFCFSSASISEACSGQTHRGDLLPFLHSIVASPEGVITVRACPLTLLMRNYVLLRVLQVDSQGIAWNR